MALENRARESFRDKRKQYTIQESDYKDALVSDFKIKLVGGARIIVTLLGICSFIYKAFSQKLRNFTPDNFVSGRYLCQLMIQFALLDKHKDLMLHSYFLGCISVNVNEKQTNKQKNCVLCIYSGVKMSDTTRENASVLFVSSICTLLLKTT